MKNYFMLKPHNMALITLIGFCLVVLAIFYHFIAQKSNNTYIANKSYLVVIDPGHGGRDPGTSGNGLVEKNVNLDICLRLTTILQESGIKTYMIRNNDTFTSPRNRINVANAKKASTYLSIHCNWFKDPSYNGTQTFYSPSTDIRTGHLLEKEYAQNLQESLINMLGVTDRGLRADPNLTVLKYAKMPSVLVEIGFLSNKDDATKLESSRFKQKTAEALANGIKKSLTKIKS